MDHETVDADKDLAGENQEMLEALEGVVDALQATPKGINILPYVPNGEEDADFEPAQFAEENLGGIEQLVLHEDPHRAAVEAAVEDAFLDADIFDVGDKHQRDGRVHALCLVEEDELFERRKAPSAILFGPTDAEQVSGTERSHAFLACLSALHAAGDCGDPLGRHHRLE